MSDALVQYLEDRLDAYLRDLHLLVGHDSGSFDRDDVNALVDRLQARLERLGSKVIRYAHEGFGDDLVARLYGSGTACVMLLGHSDTVYPRGTAAARPMQIIGDRVLGPGVCDMKAGLLAGIYAIEALQQFGWNDYGLLSFVVVSDEEIGERHSIELLAKEGARHDAILTLEAARENGDIVTARKAVEWCAIEARGRSAHAGVEPEKGSSATLALAHLIVAAAQLNGRRPGMSVNVAPIEGGRAPNIVADTARARFDLRAWTNAELVELEHALRELATRDWVPGVTLQFAVEHGSACPAMERTNGVIALEKQAMAIAAELGFRVVGAATGGASDVSFAAQAGTPGLDGLGPVGGLDHSPDEYIVLSSIVPRTALLARLIRAIANGG
jgi:glutamate carboxypeptidase